MSNISEFIKLFNATIDETSYTQNNNLNITQIHFENISCEIWNDGNILGSIPFQTSVYILYAIIFVFALIGNGFVCLVVHTTPRMKTVTNYFIVNLAIGDILMTLFCIPFSFLSQLIFTYWPFGLLMCKIVNYSQAVSVFVSAYTLVAISLDRYMAIMRPLKPRLGKSSAKFIVFLVWLGALITASPIPIVSQLTRPSEWHQHCQYDICQEKWAFREQMTCYTYALLTLQFALPLSALVCTYARIAHAVWGGRPPGEAHSTRDNRLQNSKRKMVKMMVTVVIVFIVCWLPLNLLIVLWTNYSEDSEWGKWPGLPYIWFASHWLAMSHSCYNPIIYCYMNARYRRGFQKICYDFGFKNLFGSERICRRSSHCDGLPLSEFVQANGVITRRLPSNSMSCAGSIGRSPAVTCNIGTYRARSTCLTCTPSIRRKSINNQQASPHTIE